MDRLEEIERRSEMSHQERKRIGYDWPGAMSDIRYLLSRLKAAEAVVEAVRPGLGVIYDFTTDLPGEPMKALAAYDKLKGGEDDGGSSTENAD